MNRILFFFIIFGIILHACSPIVRSNLTNTNYGPLNSGQQIVILEQGEKIPENSIFIGDLKVGDSGFSTDCGYNTVLKEAQITARKSGANIISLTKVRKPGFVSTCYRIKAEMYRNIDTSSLSSIQKQRDLKNQSRLPEEADFAIVYFYRPSNFTGSMISYKIMHNDTAIGRMNNGDKFEYKVKEFDKHTFWAKTEALDSVVLDIEQGEEYFVRCGIKMGAIVGRPEMYIMENYVAIREYDEIK